MFDTPTYKIADGENRIFIKREDLIPVCFGGNKARKAVEFFKDIDSGNYDCVVTYGSSSSNHCRIVSSMCAMRGLDCFIIGPVEASKPTYNSRMIEILGAETTFVNIDDVHDTIENKLASLRTAGRRPYFIPGGGHGNIGTGAYVSCFEEILKYEAEKNMKFDYIFFASGTGTTHAGLVCGKLIYKDEVNIVGISIARKNPYGRDMVLSSIKEFLAEKEDLKISEESIDKATVFVDDFISGGYASSDKDTKDTITRILKLHGIPMDSTYTGKAFCGMEKYLEKHKIKDKNILFLHTGGTPLFFDDINDLA